MGTRLNDPHGYIALFLIVLNVIRYAIAATIVVGALWFILH